MNIHFDETALREIHKIDSEAFAETDPVAQRFEDYRADIEEQNLDSYVIKDKNGKIIYPQYMLILYLLFDYFV